MDKKNSLGSGFSFKRKKSKKKIEEKKAEKSSFFSTFNNKKVEAGNKTDFLNDDYNNENNSNLEELFDNINDWGEKLAKANTTENIKNYKIAIKSFINYIVKNNLEIEENISGTNVLKRKRFTLVKAIDEKVEQLTLAVLKGQSEQLEILAKIDEIKGLIVDLLS